MLKKGIETWLTYRNKSEEAQLRIEAAKFVAGDDSLFKSFKKLVLMYEDLESIAIVRSIWEKVELQYFLQQNGYVFHQEINQNFVLTYKTHPSLQSISR